MNVKVNLNEEQQKQATSFGIDLLKKNMTKENASKAGNYMWNNSKMVGNMAMSAASNLAN